MSHEHAVAGYRTYWIAWVILLALTLAMILTQSRAVIIAGIAVKSAIIALWFMHLRYERLTMTVFIAATIVGVTLLLFGLTLPDATGYSP